MKMSRNQARRVVYATLNRVFGDPDKLQGHKIECVRMVLSGWLSQVRNHREKRERMGDYDMRLTRPKGRHGGAGRDKFNSLAISSYRTRAANEAPKSWRIGMKHARRGKLADVILMANTMGNPYGARSGVGIMISPNYHNTVAKHGLYHDHNKVVQKIWNHRTYEDGTEAWECLFWDLDRKVYPHAEGWVVKRRHEVRVDADLARAMREIRKSISAETAENIMKDI